MIGGFEDFKNRWSHWENMIFDEADEIERLRKEGEAMVKLWINTGGETYKYHFPLERCIEVIDKINKLK